MASEAYSHLYIGDYFADTLHLSAQEHAAFRRLLLHVWMHGVLQDEPTLPAITGLTPIECGAVKGPVLPLLTAVQPIIVEKLKALRKYDGQRLPAPDWAIVRGVVFERDDYTCTYCGTRRAPLEGDHIIPLCRGGSNDFDNVTTACRPCNQAKGSKMLDSWKH
jgi:hypothetical protein